jgi:septal ring-binding cell division protein DamX
MSGNIVHNTVGSHAVAQPHMENQPDSLNGILLKKSRLELNADKELWGIQLISSISAEEVNSFAQNHTLSTEMIEYINYPLKGQKRFAIIYGKFYSKERALKAIEELPPALRIYEPWVRAMHKA